MRPKVQDGEIDLWRRDRSVFDMTTEPSLLRFLGRLFGRRVAPIQTVSFCYGSHTPPHSDLIFLDSLPARGQMIAAWVALEDVHPEAGPLVLYPRSHKAGLNDFADLGLLRRGAVPGVVPGAAPNRRADSGVHTLGKHAPPSGRLPKDASVRDYLRAVQGAGRNYSYFAYASAMMERIQARGWSPRPALLRRGDVLIWASSLVHGGSPIIDWNRTRLSMTTHFFAEEDERGEPLRSFWKPFNSKGGVLAKKSPPFATAATVQAVAQRMFGRGRATEVGGAPDPSA